MYYFIIFSNLNVAVHKQTQFNSVLARLKWLTLELWIFKKIHYVPVSLGSIPMLHRRKIIVNFTQPKHLHLQIHVLILLQYCCHITAQCQTRYMLQVFLKGFVNINFICKKLDLLFSRKVNTYS